MPKPDEESRVYFESVILEDSRVQVSPMFGNVAGFVNGTMVMGLFGNDLFVRLSESDRATLLQEEGATIMEPVTGRPMKEYVVIPKAWGQEPVRVGEWVVRSLKWAGDMPEKSPKKSKKR